MNRRAPAIAACALLAATPYVASGALSAFLAADDFGWLAVQSTARWTDAFVLTGRAHFYRPVIELWFRATSRACGYSPACYHAISIGIHALNAVLFGTLLIRLWSDRALACAATLIFVALPGYAQAVTWVSAQTMLIASLFWLLAVHAALTGRDRGSLAGWYLAAGLSGLAVYCHESAVTVLAPVIALCTVRQGGMPPMPWRRIVSIAIPFATVIALFAVTTVAANRHSYVFTQGHYRVGGPHVLRHTFDYLTSLYVGPHSRVGYVTAACAIAVAAWRGTAAVRVGVLWLLVTLIPFLGFTWGNVSRYLYLPSMGFSLLAGGTLAAAAARLQHVWPRHTRAVRVGAALVAAVAIGRFAAFTHKAIAQQISWSDEYRRYSERVAKEAVVDERTQSVVVPAPADSTIDPGAVSPLAQWTLRRPRLRVIPSG